MENLRIFFGIIAAVMAIITSAMAMMNPEGAQRVIAERDLSKFFESREVREKARADAAREAVAAEARAREAQVWSLTENENTIVAYEEYLRQYPADLHAPVAHSRLATLREVKLNPPPPAYAQPPPSAYAPPPAQPAQPPPQYTYGQPPPQYEPPRGPSASEIAANCDAYANTRVSGETSTLGRAAVGAALGCGLGALAGGDDKRNCTVGAVAGAGGGYVSARQREQAQRELRDRVCAECIANGGPPR